MSEMRYGDAGDRIPVKVGEEWAVGNSRILCGDIHWSEAEQFFGANSIDLIYCDPPWNQGMLTGFHTKAGHHGPKPDFNAFKDRLFRLVEMVSAPVAMETGVKEVDDILSRMSHLFQDVKEYDITYYRKRPCKLVTGGIESLPALDGVDDDHTPNIVMNAVCDPGDLVLDFCTGRGLTPRTAQANKLRFIGTELAPRRMACALDSLGGVPSLTRKWR